ncbi:hypothetical protein AGABI2DRAFT_73127 [Agaricus bisporus var. bisporus H97]|uniref:hypothetical protein n=1 Tax=Agaricus bisporus var. bisporus (strain H97 / ATCC MYA-4626 / FGSC 10389) TaxID=936046 RepID=UPI00029F7420|nr:hypothetical protein AGABI2DRAFT_73127 [Agaricus bisporus var. bisporus H97]EKV45580.1 hypothetical protein AGABI2DRAFT_73127 [Agaricus bisporus var. bisporus H97]
MAAEPDQSYGNTLPDQVERIGLLYEAHLEMISDVRELYQSRTAIEREYAAKLQNLSKKAAEKKAKMEARFILGEDPTRSWDVTTLKRNTLGKAYEALITSIVDATHEHQSIADSLSTQVIDVLRTLEKRCNDTKKKANLFPIVLHIISTAVANKVKDKFYTTDMPNSSNPFTERLQTQLVERFVKILLFAHRLQLGHLDNLKEKLSNVEAKISQVQPVEDQLLFIEHNIRPFTLPDDWKYEPCTLHYDTDAMSTEPAPKIWLQNKLNRSRTKAQELAPLILLKETEFNHLSKKLQTNIADHPVGPVDDIVDSYLDAQHELSYYHTSRTILEAEIETIVAAIGDDMGGQNPHVFKSSSFSIPTQCGYCEVLGEIL